MKDWLKVTFQIFLGFVSLCVIAVGAMALVSWCFAVSELLGVAVAALCISMISAFAIAVTSSWYEP